MGEKSDVPLLKENEELNFIIDDKIKNYKKSKLTRMMMTTVIVGLIIVITILLGRDIFSNTQEERSIVKIQPAVLLTRKDSRDMDMETEIDIQEGPAHYKQRLIYNKEEESLMIHVPQHLDIHETTNILHKQSGIQMTKNYNIGTCEITALGSDTDPLEIYQGSMKMHDRNLTISPENATVKQYLTMENGHISEEERANLIPTMRRLCEGMPITRMEQIAVTKEEYEQGFVNPGERFTNNNSTNVHDRHKRSFGCRCSFEYIMTNKPIGATCEWFICVAGAFTPSCVQHLRSTRVKKCPCCGGAGGSTGITTTMRPVCANIFCPCTTIREAEDFTRCQRLAWKTGEYKPPLP